MILIGSCMITLFENFVTGLFFLSRVPICHENKIKTSFFQFAKHQIIPPTHYPISRKQNKKNEYQFLSLITCISEFFSPHIETSAPPGRNSLDTVATLHLVENLPPKSLFRLPSSSNTERSISRLLGTIMATKNSSPIM